MTKGERKTSGGSALYTDRELKEKVITHNGVEYLFKYRKPTWAERNRAMSEALTVDDDNKGHFDLDKYQRGSLLHIIKEHPFDEDLELALVKIDDEVGQQLAELVPKSIKIISKEQEDFRGEPFTAP